MANKTILDLTTAVTASGADMLYIARDPNGTPVDRKIPLSGILNSLLEASFGSGTKVGNSQVVTAANINTYAPAPNLSGYLLTDGSRAMSGILPFGGLTSSFPALKRSGTELQVRLADDSNYADLKASNIYGHALYGYGHVVLEAAIGGNILLRQGGVPKWQIDAASQGGTIGHLLPSTTNITDIGGPSNIVRSIYASSGIFNRITDNNNYLLKYDSVNVGLAVRNSGDTAFGNMMAAAFICLNDVAIHASYGFTNGSVRVAPHYWNGADRVISIRNNGGISWSSTTTLDDPAYAGLIAQSSGVIEFNRGASIANGGSYANLKTGGITASGDILFNPDATYNIGGDGFSRPDTIRCVNLLAAANVQAGNSFYFPNHNLLMYPVTAGLGATGYAYAFADSNGTINKQIIATDVLFGGTTSSFPALKRSTTELQVKLADDSNFTGLRTGYIVANGDIYLTTGGSIWFGAGTTARIYSPVDGLINLRNSANNGYASLQAGSGIFHSNVTIGSSGTPIATVIRTSLSLSFGTVNANTTAELTIQLLGVSTSSNVQANPQSALEAGMVHAYTFPVTSGITVGVRNTTAANIVNSARTWSVMATNF